MKKITAFLSTFCLCAGMFATSFPALQTFGATDEIETISASAEETAEEIIDYDKLEMTNGYYRFMTGARVGGVREMANGDPIMDLSFGLEVINSQQWKFDNAKDRAIYEFTLVRDSSEGDIPVASVKMVTNGEAMVIGHRQIVSTSTTVSETALKDNSMHFDPNQLQDPSIDYYFYFDGNTSSFYGDKNKIGDGDMESIKYEDEFNNYEIDYFIKRKSSKPFYSKSATFPTMYINLDVNSIYASYFMVGNIYFENYVESKTTGILWWKKTHDVFDANLTNLKPIRTESRSCKQVLENIAEAGMIEKEFPNAEERNIVNSILQQTEDKVIVVEYLKQIGKSPFAEKLTKQVTVPVLNDRIYYDDVCDALGEKTLNCMGSTVQGFEKKSLNIYQAVYLSSIAMKSATEDGHYKDYYIGLSQTFNEFLDDFNGNDIFDVGLFEYMLNEIHIAYPVTEAYNGDEIYGFWGCFVIPETMTMNTIWGQFFQIDPTITGISKTYEVYGDIKVGEYWDLLDEYDYTWANKLFNVVTYGYTHWGTYRAKYVMYYAKSYVESGGYDESGGTDAGDETGAIQDAINSSVGEILEAFKEFQVGNQNETNETIRSVLTLVGVMFGLMVFGGVAMYVLMTYNKKKKK